MLWKGFQRPKRLEFERETLTDRFGRMLVIAPVMSALSSVLGIYLSYWMDASPGGLVVVVQGAVFAVAYLFGPRHGLIGARLVVRRGRGTRCRSTRHGS